MKCPKCGTEIDNKTIAKEMGKIGGSKSSPLKKKTARENILKRWAKEKNKT